MKEVLADVFHAELSELVQGVGRLANVLSPLMDVASLAHVFKEIGILYSENKLDKTINPVIYFSGQAGSKPDDLVIKMFTGNYSHIGTIELVLTENSIVSRYLLETGEFV